VLACDVLPFALCAVGLALALLKARRRGLLPLVIFAGVMTLASTLALTRLEFNGHENEVQRFMVAPMYLLPLLSLLAWERMEPAPLGRAVVLLGLASGAFSSLAWLREVAVGHAPPRSSYNPPGLDLFAIDCRREAGAHFGQTASRAYVDGSFFYLYVGCAPTYVPGGERARDQWGVKLFPDASMTGFALFDEEEPGRPLRVLCPAEGRGDAVCARIADRSSCRPAGHAFLACMLAPAERTRILTGR
jgi:hypothetical protein